MSRYETEEEQVEAIKTWWKKNGTTLLSGLLVVAVAFSGWRYWDQKKTAEASNASATFEVLQMNLQQGTFGEVSRDALKLIQEQPESPYAAAAALMVAKYDFEKGEFDEAKQQLEWVRVNSSDDSLQRIATIRLARMLADNKSFSDAKAMLDGVKTEALLPSERGTYDYTSGLIALSQADIDAARDAFKRVVENAEASKSLKGIAQIQLDDLS
ncbi:YfgM family protein [Thiomicrorhabdus sp.]|uniref:YfgM family protein n=1 Tax=Thiomicrorhabdus sp. TaxID=2039724 RepID=UPI003567D754